MLSLLLQFFFLKKMLFKRCKNYDSSKRAWPIPRQNIRLCWGGWIRPPPHTCLDLVLLQDYWQLLLQLIFAIGTGIL